MHPRVVYYRAHCFRSHEEPRALRSADQIDFADLLPDLHLGVEDLFVSLRMD